MDGLPLALLFLATLLYVLHALLCVRGFLLRRASAAPARRALLASALLLHGAFVLIRTAQAGGLLTQTRLDSVALFLCLTAVAFVAAARPYRIGGAASLFWPLLAAGMVAMWAMAARDPVQRSSFARLWLILHLFPVYVGYAGFAVAAALALTYLCQERLLRRKGPSALWRRLPSLATLERMGRAALSLGFPALTVGLVVGVLWTGRNPTLLGRAWYADPKVVSGFIVWLFYAAVLHVRLFVHLHGRRAALLTVAGFLLTLVSFATVHLYTAAHEASRPNPAQPAAARAES